MAGSDVLAVLGGLFVLTSAWSVIGTVVVPRHVRSRLTRGVRYAVDHVFAGVELLVHDDGRRDAVLAAHAPAVVLAQLVAWLATFYVGFALLLLPFDGAAAGRAFAESASDMTTIGFRVPQAAGAEAIAVLASFSALGTLALQIGYLPTLYSAYNRRENAVALLAARAGVPTWGPELLARTHYGLGTGVSTLGTLPELYEEWERWAAEITESHTTYLPLVWFRSPRPLWSWVTALLGVLDSAALYLALCPRSAPEIPARLCLRGGFTCLNRVAQAMGIPVPDEADPTGGITVTYEEFLEAVARLESVGFPLERSPEEAWPHFVGWRVNYETAAFAIARAVAAPPALWSGGRRRPSPPISPVRPPDGARSRTRSSTPPSGET